MKGREEVKFEKDVFIGSIEYNCNKTSKKVKKYGGIEINICIPTLNEKEIYNLLKIRKHYKAKLTLEVEEPILDEEERKYLSGVIRPFRDNIKSIKKYGFSTGREYIHIETKDNDMMDMFPFEKGTMYKNMKLDKEYTLEDLNV